MLETLGLTARLRQALRGDFIRDGALVFGSTMLVSVLNYAVHFILSRKFGVSEYGAFVALVSALTIFGMPAAVVTMAVVKFVAEFHAVGDRAKIRLLSYRVLAGSAALAAVFLGAAQVFRPQIASYLHLTSGTAVTCAAAALAVGLVLPVIRGVLQGTQDFRPWAISSTLEAFGRIAFAVVLAYAGYGAAGALAGYALAGTMSLLYTLAAVRKHWSSERAHFTLDLRRMAATMGAAGIAILSITTMGWVDVPLVRHFFSPHDAGVYGAAAVCGKILLYAVSFIPVLVLPKAAQATAAGESPKGVLRQSLLLAFGIIAAGLTVFFLAPGLVVRMTYGAAFADSAIYIFYYGAAMSFLGITNVVVTYKIALHRYNFVWPLVAMAVCEPVAIQFLHATLWTVIGVLFAVNALAFGLCLLGEGGIALRAGRGPSLLDAQNQEVRAVS